MKTVLVTIPAQERHKKKLEAAGAGCRFVYVKENEITAEDLAQADVVIGTVPAERIQASKRLALLQLSSAGADPYIQPGILAKNTVLCNSTGAYGKAVSEHALALTLMLQKKLHRYRDAQRKSAWVDEGTVSSMADATVLVVGLGDIGLRYARMAKALGAYTIGLKRRPGACPEGVDELHLTEELDTLLERADVVASFLPGTKDTRYLYTEERFDRMRKSAIFINCGRGNAVNPEVLYRVLSEKRIAAAGIDVTEPEPLPEDSPLWALEDLVITPHVSGYYHLPETFEQVVNIACENLRAWLSGGELRNVVDFSTGYKR